MYNYILLNVILNLKKKEGIKMSNCNCENNYTEETFMESFGQNDEEMKKCNKCSNMSFEDGIMTCTKFNHKR